MQTFGQIRDTDRRRRSRRNDLVEETRVGQTEQFGGAGQRRRQFGFRNDDRTGRILLAIHEVGIRPVEVVCPVHPVAFVRFKNQIFPTFEFNIHCYGLLVTAGCAFQFYLFAAIFAAQNDAIAHNR